MNAFDFDSPLHSSELLSDLLDVDLYFKRDDLLPFPLSGNKVRKVSAELSELPAKTTHVVTTGDIGSNHCRTTAIMCAQLGIQCHLVLHNQSAHAYSAALELFEVLNATYTVVPVSEIAESISSYCERITEEGGVIHTIPGGCHTRAGANAYANAVSRLKTQFDAVIVASGTGATQGGIVGGLLGLGRDTPVYGISVARDYHHGVHPVLEAAQWVYPETRLANIIFLDQFRAGGYGKVDQNVIEAIYWAGRAGIIVDPTYTGKAMYGLRELVKSGAIAAGKRVLFWHTGGLGNLVINGINK